MTGELAAAEALHREIMPAAGRLHDYQRAMVDRLAQTDGAGGYLHPTTVVLMPRQVGKTYTTLLLMLARMLLADDYAAMYTAQSGMAASLAFNNPRDGWVPMVDRTASLSRRFRTTRATGAESLRRRDGAGSYLQAFPPTPGRLRGMSLDLVVLDECQHHDRETASQLMADAGPVMSTRSRRQLVLMGTAAGPGWWADQVAAARAGEYGLVEVGTWPDDADPADRATWSAHHPGVRAGLTDAGFLQAQYKQLGPDLFAREYGNRFTGAAAVDSPLSVELWDAARWSGELPDAPAAAGFACAPDGAWSTVVAAGRYGGTLVAAVAARATGTAWMVDTLQGIRQRHPKVALCCDPAGPTGAVADELQRRRVPVQPLKAGQRPTALAHLLQQLSTGRAAVQHHPAMDAARGDAVVRDSGTGAQWSPRTSTGDTTPILALTAAVWAAREATSVRPYAVAG